MKTHCSFLVAAIALFIWPDPARAQDAIYHNPVLCGDYPDPSVIRVGKDYYATATSSEWGPQFPILHSTDLVNWRVIGAAFAKRPEWAEQNFWAPEISAWKGKFFLYYVGRKKDGPLAVAVATADKPEGPWTDHGPLVAQAAGSIDGMAIDDEKGDRWLVWKEDGNSRQQPTPIWAQRLDDHGTKLIGEPQELFRNDQPWEGPLIEGPFVMRRGEWFYLFYAGNACCGRGCSYGTGVARAKALLGPWEKYAGNPIVGTNEHFRGPGHGSIVDDPGGRLWYFYHAYALPAFIDTGREMLMDEITFGADGWPSVNGGHGPSDSAPSPAGAVQRREERAFFDDFTGSTLQPGWQWPVADEPKVRIDRAGGGDLVLQPAPAQAAALPDAVLGRACTSADYVATAVIASAALKPQAHAGLGAFGDPENAIGITAGDGGVTVWRTEKRQRIVVARLAGIPSPHVHLRMTATGGHLFQFAVSADGKEWKPVGEAVDGDYLPPWDRGIRIGLTAGGAEGADARFESFRMEPVTAE